MKYLIICLFITGCSTTNQLKFEETLECSNYRGMMTAPLPPNEVNKLKQKCEQSQQN